jgi:hypothetical protein
MTITISLQTLIIKMTLDNHNENVYIQIDENDTINIFGGEVNIYDTHEDLSDVWTKYGFQIHSDDGSVTVDDMTRYQYIKLGLSIINHLMDNGQDFEFTKRPDDGSSKLIIKH